MDPEDHQPTLDTDMQQLEVDNLPLIHVEDCEHGSQPGTSPTPHRTTPLQPVQQARNRNLKDKAKGMKLKITPSQEEDPIASVSPLPLEKMMLIVEGCTHVVTTNDLQHIATLGKGFYGTVDKMLHTPTGVTMAVKRLQYTQDKYQQKVLAMDLEILQKTEACPYIVHFYGALFAEGDLWLCMEVMDTSLERFYKLVHGNNLTISETVLGKIAAAVIKGLHYLKSELNVIHRDVKPSNILINRSGEVKICDFGISGHLVQSLANTRDAGCKPYMAPERINPESGGQGYDIRSDVWSLGITMMELATGEFPYPKWNTPFEQLKHVVRDDPPRLPAGQFSPQFEAFISQCLIKEKDKRPNYSDLMQNPFFDEYDKVDVDVADFVTSILERFGGYKDI